MGQLAYEINNGYTDTPLQFSRIYWTDHQCFLSSVEIHVRRNYMVILLLVSTCTKIVWFNWLDVCVSIEGRRGMRLTHWTHWLLFATNFDTVCKWQWWVSGSSISPVLLIYLPCCLYQSLPLLVFDRWSKFHIAAACIELEITKFVSWCLHYHHHSTPPLVYVSSFLPPSPLAPSMCTYCIYYLMNRSGSLYLAWVHSFVATSIFQNSMPYPQQHRRHWLFDSYQLCCTPYHLYIIIIYYNVDSFVWFYWLYPWFLTLIFATFCVVLLVSCILCTIAGNTNSVLCTGTPISLLFTALLNVYLVVLVISLLFGIDFWFHLFGTVLYTFHLQHHLRTAKAASVLSAVIAITCLTFAVLTPHHRSSAKILNLIHFRVVWYAKTSHYQYEPLRRLFLQEPQCVKSKEALYHSSF